MALEIDQISPSQNLVNSTKFPQHPTWLLVVITNMAVYYTMLQSMVVKLGPSTKIFGENSENYFIFYIITDPKIWEISDVKLRFPYIVKRIYYHNWIAVVDLKVKLPPSVRMFNLRIPVCFKDCNEPAN